jgi:hypothetical protein
VLTQRGHAVVVVQRCCSVTAWPMSFFAAFGLCPVQASGSAINEQMSLLELRERLAAAQQREQDEVRVQGVSLYSFFLQKRHHERIWGGGVVHKPDTPHMRVGSYRTFEKRLSDLRGVPLRTNISAERCDPSSTICIHPSTRSPEYNSALTAAVGDEIVVPSLPDGPASPQCCLIATAP